MKENYFCSQYKFQKAYVLIELNMNKNSNTLCVYTLGGNITWNKVK
jgi:hypothetical protein